MSKGKLIVIEACDSSGKETQTRNLFKRLISENIKVKKIDFPNYKSDSSALVKMYLNGEFGNNTYDVNPYSASLFYTVDRFASYKKEWEEEYLNDTLIIADRYTTSNAIHQAAKFKSIKERNDYLDWLYDIEYNKVGLPTPDCIIFLEMPPEYSIKLMQNRKNKITHEDKKDIHEIDHDFIYKSYRNACSVANKSDWIRVKCVKNDELRTIEDIGNEIYNIVISLI